FIMAARLAYDAGVQFVGGKQCHGYLGHELLGARTRPGRYGGSLENRTRSARHVIEGIRASIPALQVVVRISVFDFVPYRKDATGVGVPEDDSGNSPGNTPGDAPGFGVVTDENLDAALEEARQWLKMLEGLGVRWICAT